MDGALALLREYLLTVPYCDNTDYEGHYQQLFYIIFSLLGHYVDVEVRTPRGRVDIVMRTATKLYVIELKLNQPATVAMEQIQLKDYPSRFALCGLPVVKVGISFDTEKKTIGEWVIERCPFFSKPANLFQNAFQFPWNWAPPFARGEKILTAFGS